ncbi:helix-turn-helix domain-containing protein [Sporomusa acidovorans]|uniref:HTH cro/C1-type domain-containing protein n=1 Tax=Sporomusa acidovorans (strain ATCC 49682 / DSM 3132 / Mol) TaxID=1123286 RepID=A0ABZ3J708_SPOA4|nr:helix-turn-helix transcriptional regulator [Sporomusa acidovorans]OZC18530.1 helix-turn-helix domain protein [Sporomusa acidovorans DSM 3132]SDE37371.1 Helix-turn-helix domain-containing protein [Sporomusa acidovorans]
MNFGDKVRYVREKFSLTAEQLAKILNVTQSYISHVENNRRQFGRDKIILMANKLRIPVEFFLREDVETLEQLTNRDKLEAFLGDERYLDYFIVLDQAVKADITPKELERAINYIKEYKVRDD